MSDVAADALVVKGEILVEYAKPYGLNRNPNVNLASLGITKLATACACAWNALIAHSNAIRSIMYH